MERRARRHSFARRHSGGTRATPAITTTKPASRLGSDRHDDAVRPSAIQHHARPSISLALPTAPSMAGNGRCVVVPASPSALVGFAKR